MDILVDKMSLGRIIHKGLADRKEEKPINKVIKLREVAQRLQRYNGFAAKCVSTSENAW